jgi:hypothetical protein
MVDVFYERTFHPLAAGSFRWLAAVEQCLSQWGEEIASVRPGTDDWAALDDLEARLRRGDMADQFHRYRYAGEDEDDPAAPERYAFSFHWGEYIFAGLLLRDLASGQWDEQSALVVGNRISCTYLHSPRLVGLAETLVRNTRGTVNDQTVVMRQLREDERASDLASEQESLDDLLAEPDSTGGFLSSVGGRLRRWGAGIGTQRR